MRILVVGSNGFLGSQIVKQLRDEGHVLQGLNRGISPLNHGHFIGDIATPSSYQEALLRWQPEVVIQTAWVTTKETYRSSNANVGYAESTISFAEACYRSDVQHFIGLGSSAEYGIPSKPCVAGVTATDPIDIYGSSKVFTSQKILEISKGYSKRFTWARVFQPYGPGQDLFRLIPSAIQSLLSQQTVFVKNPRAVLDWITTRDVASAVAFLLSRDLPEFIDIASGVPCATLSLVQELVDQLGFDTKSILIPSKSIDEEVSPLFIGQDSPLLKSGWTPQDNIQSGVKWTLGL